MKSEILRKRKWFAFLFAGLFCSAAAFGQATLKHSYTFEDGTANDVIGTAHGTVVGGTIANGAWTGAANGEYIDLPGADIAINTYSAITLEAMIYADVDNTGATMMAYFGGNENGVGGNGYFMTPDRWTESRTAISCGNVTQPWNAEQGVTAGPVAVGEKHYLVSILTGSSISWYIDGVLEGTAEVSGNNSIANISNDLAMLAKGGYDADPTWMGSIHEFNIYEGELDAATMAQNISDFLGVNVADATLASLGTNKGPVDPAFDPAVDLYEIYVPFGTTSLTIDAIPAIEGATVAMFDGLGNEITDGTVTFGGDGIDVEIIVTALNGTTEKSYFLSIFLNPGVEVATLSSIDLSVGDFTTAFDTDLTDYTAIVPLGTTSVDVTAVPTWSGATVTGDGTITLTDGAASVAITVTSEDGQATQVYNVDIYESKIAVGNNYYIKHDGSVFVVTESGEPYNQIVMDYPLRDEPRQLFQLVESGVPDQFYLKNGTNQYLTLVKDPVWDMIMVPELTNDPDSCRFIIDEFEPGRVKIYSVARLETPNYLMGPNSAAQGGIFSDKYPDNQLAIWNILPPDEVVSPFDTDLAELSVDPGSITPEFNPFITEYYVTFPVGTTTATVTAVANDGTATVTGDGAVDVSAGAGSVTVTVTATDTQYKKDYVIHYMVNTPLTLMHSYTFADGTAEDVVGDADGTVIGGAINNGVYSATANGHHITLPGGEIAINTYPSITVELYLADDASTSNDVNTMTSYFGNTAGTFGTDYYFTSLKSRAAISCNNSSDPWATENGVTGTNLLDDGSPHHLVSVLNNDSITLYLDGVYTGMARLTGNNSIRNLSTAFAYLCKSGYVNDLTWLGDIMEYNIYSGQMDGTTIATRAIDFPLEDSTTDATLSDLMVDGATIEGFASPNLAYEVVLPRGTTAVPTVTATPKISTASAAVTAANEVPGTSTVLVTAEDGTTTNTYTITFSLEASAEATLSDLTVDGTTIEGFEPGVTTYNYGLAAGTTTVPAVAGTASSTGATVDVTDADALPGTTTIVVTAEDGETTATYYVNFIFVLSADATLSDLTVDGTTVEGFDPTVTAYAVELPQGTTVIPTVNATTNHPNASFTVNDATELPGISNVVVTAEDGTTKKTYYVNFTLDVSSRDIHAAQVKVYPTVSNGSFKVITGEGMHSIEIYDMTGSLVSETISHDHETVVRTPKTGIYIMKIGNDAFVRTFRIIHAE